ncbi:nucleoside-diphosphate sugar epimerase/dehydratase [Flavobacterium sp. HSC-61S13]|uniref:polysaccharide biosynthesis protein n=1 Tax=Flavobacterium sp. HSC-61S13 TaxID=2910963 RepID=UPI00209CAD79|nr:nucleoside-diphosphate sugar epimerase/dehydratase [Flavobacterium sp. HSC-61S13]MCP1996501.1 FlaA1/EpsC-like NDP-sugar epimerase [Flavobacterium sp. HSC-61S13]
MESIKARLKRDTPRGIVLCIDVFIVVFCFLISNIILSSFYGVFNLNRTLCKVPTVMIVYFLTFILLKTHRGVVRQTGLKDAQSVFVSCFFAAFALTIIAFLQRNGVLPDSTRPYFRFSYSIIMLHMLLTVVVMVAARIFYSNFYKTFVLGGRNVRRVLIYGAGDSGVITIKALQTDTRIDTQVLGFIDDNPKKVGKKINGLPVLSPSVITMGFLLKNRIDDIVISIQNISRERLNEISAVLEVLPVEIKIIPPPTDWLNGKYSGMQIKQLKIEDLLGRKSIEIDNPIVNQEIEGKVILITGAAGSIGSEIARQIARKDFKELILLDQAESALYDVQQSMECTTCSRIQYIVGNVREEKRMDVLFATYKPDIVYHAAAYKHVPLMEYNPYEAVTTNISGTKIIADLSVKHQAQKFVMISTDKAVNPTNVMGATKRIAEIYVNGLDKNTATSFIVTRFGNVLGSNGSVIPLFKNQIEKGGPLTVTHKDITRYFMTIPEACQLVLEASVMGKGGEIFVFDMGESMKIFELAQRMIRLSGYNYPKDIDIEFTGLRPGEKIFEELLADDENTLKTHHEKIMIAQVRTSDHEQLSIRINELCVFATETEVKPNNSVIVQKIKDIVPEYKSQNSTYQSLD